MESDFTNGDIKTTANGSTLSEKQNGHCVKSTTSVEEDNNTCRIYELEEVQKHASEDDCWVINNNSVYDVTKFLHTHPGGAELILGHAGGDITHTLRDDDLHMHSVHAYNLLREYKIGELPDDAKTYNSDTDNKDLSGFKEDLVDWDKGLVFQVHRFGHDYLRWVHSPVNRKLKLFDSEFIEFFSKTKWYMIPLVWIPITILCSIYSYGELTQTIKRLSHLSDGAWGFGSGLGEANGYRLLSTISFILLFIFGIPLWTLMEYALHRYVFHMEPRGDSPFMITMHFFFHGQHHKVPFDEDRLVFPPAAAAAFVLGFWKFFNVLLPGGIGSSLFCGGLLGYIGYDLIHYYMHHGAPERGSYLHDMKRYHVMHHFNDPNTGFGISTKFWDRPFNTFNKKLL